MSRGSRTVAALAMLAGLLAGIATVAAVVGAGAASAAPAVPRLDDPQKTLDTFTPGTGQFQAADWTTPACKNAGGSDFGRYLSEFSAAAPTLARSWYSLHPQDPNFNAPHGLTALFFLMGKDFTTPPPSPSGSYCIGDLVKWDGPSGVRADWPNLAQNKTGFFLDCARAPFQQRSHCANWNQWAQAYRDSIVVDRAGPHMWPHHAKSPVCYADKTDHTLLVCGQDGLGTWAAAVLHAAGHQAAKVAKWLGEKGMQQVVDFAASSGGSATGWVAPILHVQPNVDAAGFADMYRLVAGAAMGLVGLAFLISLIRAMLPGGGSISQAFVGLAHAVVSIVLCGAIVWAMVYIANAFTQALAAAIGAEASVEQLVTALQKANPAVAILAGIAIVVSVVCLLVLMLLRVPFVYGLGLFGPLFAVGAMSPETAGWQKKWFFRLLAVCWAPFFVVALYGLGMRFLVGPSAALVAGLGGNDELTNSATAVLGAAILLGVALMPKLLIEVLEFVDSGGASRLLHLGGQTRRAATGGPGQRPAGSSTPRRRSPRARRG